MCIWQLPRYLQCTRPTPNRVKASGWSLDRCLEPVPTSCGHRPWMESSSLKLKSVAPPAPWATCSPTPPTPWASCLSTLGGEVSHLCQLWLEQVSQNSMQDGILLQNALTQLLIFYFLLHSLNILVQIILNFPFLPLVYLKSQYMEANMNPSTLFRR